MESVGLILEREANQRIHFVKIHIPTHVVAQYAELLKIRMPIKGVSALFTFIMNCMFTNKVKLNDKLTVIIQIIGQLY